MAVNQRALQDWQAEWRIRRALRPVLFTVPAITLLCLLAQIALALEAMLMLDVALPGRSGETIAGMVAMSVATIALLLGCIGLRQRLLRQAGHMIAFRAARLTPTHSRVGELAADGRDMDLARRALTGGGVAALIDLAQLPLLACVLILLGWPMAVALLAGGVIGVALLLTGRSAIRVAVDAADGAVATRDEQLQVNTREKSLIRQLGMTEPMREREEYAELAALDPLEALGRTAGRHRLVVTALVAVALIAIGALAVWRATLDRAGFGTIAGVLVIAGFALWPLRTIADRQVELARGHAAWRRLSALLGASVPEAASLPLPSPTQLLNAEGIAIPAAGERRVVFQNGTFQMKAGDITVLIGPSDTGKSMLLRALAGVAPEAIGNVRLDGATLAQYGETARATHIGYMPQSCDLLPGTISQNIAEFRNGIDPSGVVAAAQMTGAHEVIVRLPQGYDTIVGGPDCTLSHSTRQRICLARAFFGDPFVLLLDSPDSHQDRFGRAALVRALEAARARGAIAVVAGESTSVIDVANLAMVLRKGGIAHFGPKDEVRERMRAREEIANQGKPAAVAASAPVE